VGRWVPSSLLCYTKRRVRKIAKKLLLASSHLPVCPPVRTQQLNSHWTDLHEIWYLSMFRKYVEKIQVSFKSDKNNGYIIWRPITFFLSYLAHVFSGWEVFQTKAAENKNIHFMFNNFFRKKKKCRLWKNTVQPGRPQLILGMRIACWIPKATNTFRICNTYCFSTATMVA